MRCFVLFFLLTLVTIPALAGEGELILAPWESQATTPVPPFPTSDAPPAVSIAGPGGKMTPQRADAALAINRFGWSLYQTIAPAEKGNIFLSPFSISTALTMTLAGAGGQTRQAMGSTLQLAATDDGAVQGIALLADELNRAGEAGDFALSVANALYGEKSYAFKADYIEFLGKSFGAALTAVDFIGAANEARTMINTWVEEKTAGKIKNLIPDGVLNALTRLVLVNAIYFKGNWASQFDKAATRDSEFHRADGTKIPAKMMHQTRSFPYIDAGEFQAVRLPYQGERLSMLVLLPAPEKNIDEVCAGLSAERFRDILNDMGEEKLHLYLPRFKVDFAVSLKPILEKLGMAVAFGDDADFSAMTAKNDLKITAVIHKAFVQVNEEGTEAAAATAVVVGRKSISFTPEFRADRPFLYAIIDNPTGAMLFLGRLMEPGEQE